MKKLEFSNRLFSAALTPTTNVSVTRTAFSHYVKWVTKSLGFLLAPGQCVLCELPSQRPRDLCRCCEQSLSWIKSPCYRCALPQTISGIRFRNSYAAAPQQPCTECVRCQRSSSDEFLPHRMVAPLAYRGCTSALVKQIKHRRGDVAARVLAELLGDALLRHYPPRDSSASQWPDAMIAVPLHWQRELRRGHNQSALITQHLHSRLGVPVLSDVVQRTQATPHQRKLNRQHRAANLAGAFQLTISAAGALQGRSVAIVDDVVTTLATVRALAAALNRAGVAQIHVWSPARAILAPQATAHIETK